MPNDRYVIFMSLIDFNYADRLCVKISQVEVEFATSECLLEVRLKYQ